MLTFYGSGVKGPVSIDRAAAALPSNVDWIDAFEPSADDMAFLERVMDVRIPSQEDLIEIESSSRLATDGEAFIMSLPATMKDATGYPGSTPVGLVVTRDRAVTIRFARLPSFENLAKQVCAKGELSRGGIGAAVSILEIIVDHIADLLERIGGELDQTSRSIFATGAIATTKNHRPRQSNDALRGYLGGVGRNADLVSKVSESLLGLSRIPPFLTTKAADLISPETKTRLDTIGIDAKSLHEYQEHLANKTQFLLDAVLGLANIEQNNVFRVLTVVSVIGIPPTFFASMYGMNFKSMPEYDWAYGYAWGLSLIILSAVGPAVWFKIKGWW